MEQYEKPILEIIEMPRTDIVSASCDLDSGHECEIY